MYSCLTLAVQQRGELRRRALLEATLRVIGAGGTRAVSHRSVAEEAGVPLGSTTYYFESRDHILVQALRFAADQEIAQTGRALDELGPDALSVEALAGWLDRRLRGASRHRITALYSLQLEAVHRPELRPIYEEWTVATVRMAQRLLEAGGAPDPVGSAPLLVAALDGLRHNQLATRDAGVARRAARAVLEPLLRQTA